MKDIPTPESDAARFISEYITQEDAVPYELSQSLEQRLAIAVAENARLKSALDKYSEDEVLSVPLHYELMGVIEDIEHGNGFDDRCLQTLKRVMAQLQEKHQQDRRKP